MTSTTLTRTLSANLTPSVKGVYEVLTDGRYTVGVVVLHTERILNSADGNPCYRFHTDKGIYTTASDAQQSFSLTGEESGPAMLCIQNSQVIAWSFIKTKAD